MLVALAVAGVEAGGVDGQLDAALLVLIDLEPPVEAVKALTRPQKCETRNSAFEPARSSRQRVPARPVMESWWCEACSWDLRGSGMKGFESRRSNGR